LENSHGNTSSGEIEEAVRGLQPFSPESSFEMVAHEESGLDGGGGDLYLYMYWRRLGASRYGSVWILFVVAVVPVMQL
jgi:hypothetical protein